MRERRARETKREEEQNPGETQKAGQEKRQNPARALLAGHRTTAPVHNDDHLLDTIQDNISSTSDRPTLPNHGRFKSFRSAFRPNQPEKNFIPDNKA